MKEGDFVTTKSYKNLKEACNDLKSKVIKSTGYKDELNRWIGLVKLESVLSNNFYYLETTEGIWTTNVSSHGYQILNKLPVYCHEGKSTHDFYNFVTKNNLTYEQLIILVDSHQKILNPSIKISDFLKTLSE